MKNIHIIITQPEGAINIGLTARAMKNFNFRNLVLISPTVDIKSKESYQFATHAEDILEHIQIEDSLENIVDRYSMLIGFSRRTGQFRRKDFELKELTPFLAKTISSDPALKIGLLFGNETSGLSEHELNFTDFLCSIPTHSSQGSLNLSHAIAVVLYEMSQLTLKPDVTNLARLDDINNSIDSFIQFLKEIKYFEDSLKKERLIHYLRKLFSRGIREKSDALVITNLFNRLSGIYHKSRKLIKRNYKN